MRIRPVAPAPRPWLFGATEAPFTPDSPLQATILRMINTNALAAFTTQVAPTRPATPVRSASPGASAAPVGDIQPPQLKLDAVPTAPTRPLPRGSLLDLRV
jgi:hypothetical protein